MSSSYDGYARHRIDALEDRVQRQSAASRASSRRKAQRRLELEERVAILEKVVVGLLECLDRTGTVNDELMEVVLADIDRLDENGDGTIDAHDLKDKYDMPAEEAERRAKSMAKLVAKSRRDRLRRQRGR